MRKIRYFALGALLSISFGVAAQQFGIPRFVQDLTVRGNLQVNGTTTLNGVSATDFARLSASLNTFTGQRITIANDTPFLSWDETDASADNQFWDIGPAQGSLRFRVVNDAHSVTTNWLVVNRTGTTVDSIELDATTIELNGVASSDFARLSASNTYTSTASYNQARPSIILYETDQASDVGRWEIAANTGHLVVNTTTDAGVYGETPIRLIRDVGTNVSTIELRADSLLYNTSPILSQADEGPGNGLDADTVDGSHASDFFAASEVTQGTFTAVVEFCSSGTTNYTAEYTRVGDLVTVMIPAISCTVSTALPRTIGGLPVELRIPNNTPDLQVSAPIYYTNPSATLGFCWLNDGASDIVCGSSFPGGAGAFSNGDISISGFTLSYQIQ